MKPTSPNAATIDKLQAGIHELTSSDAWKRYLDTQSKFHNYSWRNTLLIATQRPDATRVAGYNDWQKLGRQVQKGEKGIQILAPCTYKKEEPNNEAGVTEAKVVRGFKTTFVFDVSQTEGTPLPEVTIRLLGDTAGEAYHKLTRVATRLNFAVQLTDSLPHSIAGTCNHVATRIQINSILEPDQAVKTLAHELAHAILHNKDTDMARGKAELEAESVAYIVCAELGIDSSQYSFGYVAGWAGPDAEKLIAASASLIQAASGTIIEELEGLADPPMKGAAA